MAVNTMNELIEHAHETDWHKTIIMEAEAVLPEDGEILLQGLIMRADAEPAVRPTLYLLADACQERIEQVSASTKKTIRQRLRKVIPPRKVAQAIELAKAKDLAVAPIERYLSEQGRSDERPCAYCIRTLALIGSQAALKVLEAYALECRSTHCDTENAVDAEFLRGLHYVERDEYIQRVLGPFLQNVKILTLDTLPELLPLPMPNLGLVVFTEGRWRTLDDLQRPAISPQLKSVTISNCFKLRDVRGLSCLSSFEYLFIASRHPDLFKNFPQLSRLEQLVLWRDDSSEDLAIIAPLTSLRELELMCWWALRDISALDNLTNLHTLRLLLCDKLKDVSVLSHMPSFKHLHLAGVDPYQLKGFSDLTKLEHLELASSPITDLADLTSFTHLQKLSLRDCHNLKDLSALDALVNLQVLEITRLRVNEVNLGALTDLRELYVRDCGRLKQVNGLQDLKKLEAWCFTGQVTLNQPIQEALAKLQTTHPNGEIEGWKKLRQMNSNGMVEREGELEALQPFS